MAQSQERASDLFGTENRGLRMPKDTDTHRPDGTIFKGDKRGHADERYRIRERD
jgi:hypothetical protein